MTVSKNDSFNFDWPISNEFYLSAELKLKLSLVKIILEITKEKIKNVISKSETRIFYGKRCDEEVRATRTPDV